MGYAHPEVLVETDWVKQHLTDPRVRLIEVDVDTKAYDAGHIKGAVGWNWQTQLQDQVRRDIIAREEFERLAAASGIASGDTVVLYGDNNNWFAAYAFWLFKIYRHEDVRLINGGRQKWLDEADKELTVEHTVVKPGVYRVAGVDPGLRALLRDAVAASESHGAVGLVDVRSPDEYSGKVIAPPGMSETAQRGGHIPGARSIPWMSAVATNGAFKGYEELYDLYVKQKKLEPAAPTIAYCRIGERSSHTWFVLKYLLGFANVRNYDGSWTEYGNLVGAPIEK
jgi:thiosulfate/3-mercaptopyruvate sulfurtransferase